MKRKDYITETKSIEHMNGVMGAILRDDPKPEELVKYLKLIPVNFWDKIEALDTKLKTYSGYRLGNLGYNLVMATAGLDRREVKKIIRKLDEYVCYSFDHVWSDEIVTPPQYQLISGLTTQRLGQIHNYVNNLTYINIPTGQSIMNRVRKESDRVYQAEQQIIK